jgi:hypothetical protein
MEGANGALDSPSCYSPVGRRRIHRSQSFPRWLAEPESVQDRRRSTASARLHNPAESRLNRARRGAPQDRLHQTFSAKRKRLSVSENDHNQTDYT